MVRLYGDPARDAVDVIDVRRDDRGALPEQFLWRGRLYLVREVLAHWVEIGTWWRDRLPDGLPARIDEAGCQVWRVEAGAGRGAAVGVFDLTFDEATSAWTLARALD